LLGTRGSSINSIHFEGEDTFTTFILFSGTSSSFPCVGVSVNDCYFNAHGLAEYNIKIQYGLGIIIKNPSGYAGGIATLASIWLDNEAQGLLLIEPKGFFETYLLGSTPASMLTSRIAGSVIQDRNTGVIAKAGEDMRVPGTVVRWTTGGVVLNCSDVDQNLLAPILYGQSAGYPVVVATSGVAQVYTNGAVNGTYNLVSSATSGQAGSDNSVTINKKILGYALETTGAPGLVWTKLQG
jgi:hypothetical protein